MDCACQRHLAYHGPLATNFLHQAAHLPNAAPPSPLAPRGVAGGAAGTAGTTRLRVSATAHVTTAWLCCRPSGIVCTTCLMSDPLHVRSTPGIALRALMPTENYDVI